MTDRDSYILLAFGAAVAALLHLLVVPVGVADWSDSWTLPPYAKKKSSRDQEQRETVLLPLGREESSVSSVAWIAYDDFRQLMAQQSQSLQPALQQEVDPTADAPLELDPTPPTPAGPREQAALAALPDAMSLTGLAESPAPAPLPLPPPEAVGQVPFAPWQPSAESAPPAVAAATAPAPVIATSTSAAGEPSRPTSAPRSDRESDPVQIDPDTLERRPGGVLAGKGLEIQTARPQFSVITQLTAAPRDTRVQIIFNREGQVIEAKLLQSTGFKDVDAAILASLYKWKARGEELQQANPHLTLTIDYNFVD